MNTPTRSKLMSQYVKKPIVTEAHPWFKNGDHPLDGDRHTEGLLVRYNKMPERYLHDKCLYCRRTMHDHGWIDTLEGGHLVCPGDWIITGIEGEHYPCKPDIFEATYTPQINTALQTAYLSGTTVEDLARAWASIDGERAGFDSRDPDLGFYEGYMAETEEILKRAVGYAKARDEQFNIDLNARLTKEDRVVALVHLRGSDIYDCKTKAK